MWQASAETGQYFDNLCRSWVDALDEFQYRTVAAHGNAAEIVATELRQMPDSTEVYLSGPSADVTVLAATLENAGISPLFVNR